MVYWILCISLCRRSVFWHLCLSQTKFCNSSPIILSQPGASLPLRVCQVRALFHFMYWEFYSLQLRSAVLWTVLCNISTKRLIYCFDIPNDSAMFRLNCIVSCLFTNPLLQPFTFPGWQHWLAVFRRPFLRHPSLHYMCHSLPFVLLQLHWKNMECYSLLHYMFANTGLILSLEVSRNLRWKTYYIHH